MTETEYLLTVLEEEAAEIIQACCKAKRFGLQDGYPGTDRTNIGDLLLEISHLKAVVEMLGFDKRPSERSLIDEKIKKVREFMEYSRKQGTLGSWKKGGDSWK